MEGEGERRFRRNEPVQRNEVHPRSTEDVRQLGNDCVDIFTGISLSSSTLSKRHREREGRTRVLPKGKEEMRKEKSRNEISDCRDIVHESSTSRLTETALMILVAIESVARPPECC